MHTWLPTYPQYFPTEFCCSFSIDLCFYYFLPIIINTHFVDEQTRSDMYPSHDKITISGYDPETLSDKIHSILNIHIHMYMKQVEI